MSWRKKRDDELKRFKEMFPWIPTEFLEDSGFFNDDFINQMTQEIERMMKQMNIDIHNPESIRKMGPMVWGWNMQVGPDGKPTFKKFGNVKPSVRGEPVATKDREPLVDVFVEDKQVRIVAELPGVGKDDINVKTTETRVLIDAKSGERTYSCQRDLSVSIKPKTASAKYRNGILELTIERKEPAKAEEGFEVHIE